MNIKNWPAAAAACLTLVLLLVGGSIVGVIPGIGDNPAEAGDAVCADPAQEFLAYQTPDAKFGPAVEQRELAQVQQELHRRRCLDPALLVAHQEFYVNEAKGQPYRTEADRAYWIAFYAANRAEHSKAVAALEHFEATEMAKAEVRHERTDNWSMWMVDSQPQPTIVAGPSDVVEFDALVFTDGNGKEYVFKLDCGFQPMVPVGTPLPPLPPPGTPPPTVPVTPPCENCGPPPSTPNPCPNGCPITSEPPICTENCEPPVDVCPLVPGDQPVVPEGYNDDCLTPKVPSEDVNVNPSVPDQVQGPGGGGAVEPEEPVDSETGCVGSCTPIVPVLPTTTTVPSAGSGTSGDGSTLPPGGDAGISDPEAAGVPPTSMPRQGTVPD